MLSSPRGRQLGPLGFMLAVVCLLAVYVVLSAREDVLSDLTLDEGHDQSRQKVTQLDDTVEGQKATVRYVSSLREFLLECAPDAFVSEFKDVMEAVSVTPSLCIDEVWTGSRSLRKLDDVRIRSDHTSRKLRAPEWEKVPFGQRGIVLSTLIVETLKASSPKELPVFLQGTVRWAESLKLAGVPGLLYADDSAIEELLQRQDIVLVDDTMVFANATRVEVTRFDRDDAARELPLTRSSDMFPTLRRLVPGVESYQWDTCADKARRLGNLNSRRAADLLHVNDLRYAVVAQATAKDGFLEKRGYGYAMLMDAADARLSSNPFIAIRAASRSLPVLPLFVGYEANVDITSRWMDERFGECFPTHKRPSWMASPRGQLALYNAGVVGGSVGSLHAFAEAVSEFFPCVLSQFGDSDTRDNQLRLGTKRSCNMMAFNVLASAIRKSPTLAFDVTDGALGVESSDHNDCAVYAGSPFVSRFKYADRCGAIVFHK